MRIPTPNEITRPEISSTKPSGLSDERLSDTDPDNALEVYRERAKQILGLVGKGQIHDILKQPEFEGLGYEVGKVLFYDVNKKFGFALVDGEKVFFGANSHTNITAGLHSIPDYGKQVLSEESSQLTVRKGDIILISRVIVPDYTDKSLNNLYQRDSKKGLKTPSADFWVSSAEYMQAIKEIYTREPRVPGMYCTEEGLSFIDKPWSIPHIIDNDNPILNNCSVLPVKLDHALGTRLPSGKDVVYMLELAKQKGLVGGEDILMQKADEIIAQLNAEIGTWRETCDLLIQVRQEMIDGKAYVVLGDIRLELSDGTIPRKSIIVPYGLNMDLDDDSVVYLPVLDSIGGITSDDVPSKVWEYLVALDGKLSQDGSDIVKETDIINVFEEFRDKKIGQTKKSLDAICDDVYQILQAILGDSAIDECPAMQRQKKYLTALADWRKKLADLRRRWHAVGDAIKEEQIKAIQIASTKKQQELEKAQLSRAHKEAILPTLTTCVERLAHIQQADPNVEYPQLLFEDDTYITFCGRSYYYSKETLDTILYSIVNWENKLNARNLRDEFKPKFEQYIERAINASWVLRFFEDCVYVASNRYEYCAEGLNKFVEDLCIEEDKAKQLLQFKAEREQIATNPAIENFGGKYRRMGATRQCDYWVIRADGTLRPGDKTFGRYEAEGQVTWPAVGQDELALGWSKYDVRAEHCFTVAFSPATGPTAQQLSTIKALELKLQEAWSIYDDRADDPRGDKSSPPIGDGWGFGVNPIQGQQYEGAGDIDLNDEPSISETPASGEEDREVSEDALMALAAKFKKH